jgi:hypothetical protein
MQGIDANVAQMTGKACGPTIELTVLDQGATDASAHGENDKLLTSLACTVTGFAQTGYMHVIVYSDGQVQGRFEFGS